MSAPSAPVAPGRRQARDLEPAEIDAFLRDMRVAVLATAAEGVPYAVPIVYGYDGTDFFIAMRDGRKARNLDGNPIACLTVVDVQEIGARWRSVVVTGTAQWLTGVADRLRALDALRRQQGTGFAAAPRDVARLAGARVLRISPTTVTGRAVGV